MSEDEKYAQEQCDSARSEEFHRLAELNYANKDKKQRGVDWSKIPALLDANEIPRGGFYE